MKYIVDIDDFEPLFKVDSIGVFGIGKSVNYSEEDHSWSRIKSVEEFEELNSDYINEHYGSLQDEAYQRGYDDATKMIASDEQSIADKAYQRGLDDAWEAARKIFGYEIDGGIPIDEVGRVFGYSEDATFCTADIIRHNTASEAIAKLKAYEEKQNDKIVVGDEFVTDTGKRFVVLRVDENGEVDRYFDSEGKTYRMNVKYSSMKKTGRHFDIASILEDMRNG